MTTKGINVASTGRYNPETIVSNDDLAKMMDTSDEWISSRTGIRTRRVVKGEPTSRMAINAALDAMSRFPGTAEDIGLVICSTITPDFYTPSVSCMVQAAVGAKNAFCFDIACACSGFVQAVDMAHKYITSGTVRAALVVSAEVLSRISNFEDRATCVLFGDGAGACVITAGEQRYASFMGADGTGAEYLYATHRYPMTPFETQEEREKTQTFPCIDDAFLHMNGKEVYKFSTAVMPLALAKACEGLGVGVGDLKYIVPHQANVRIVRTAMKHLGLPEEKAYLNISKYGNTSSASIPMALDELNRSGQLQRGDLIALVGFGAGLTYAAAALEW